MSDRSDIVARIGKVSEAVSRRILLLGESGMGKSTIVAEAASALRASGHWVLSANPSYAESGIAYSTLWDMLSTVDWESDARLSDDYRLFLRIALGAPEPHASLPPLAVSVAVEALLANLAESGPVVLMIDDAQWVDPESQLVLQRAWRRSRNVPLYTVTTRRTPAAHDGPDGGLDDADSIVLPGLTPVELDELARSVRDTPLSRAELAALHAHTAGNPMWALELVRRGDIADLSALPVGSIGAPATLVESVEARLAQLGADAADLVAMVALVGRSTIEQVVAVLDLDETPHAAMAEAERAGFLTIAIDSLRVTHPLHASAAVSRLDPAQRRALHAAIARTETAVEAHAHHLTRSERPGPNEKIAAKLDLASKAAGRRGAPIRGGHFSAKAVARSEPGSIGEQHRLLSQAHHLVSAGDYSSAVGVLDRVEPLRLDAEHFDLFVALSDTSVSFTRGWASSSELIEALGRQLPPGSDGLLAIVAAFSEPKGASIAGQMAVANAALSRLDPAEAPNAVRRAIGVVIRGEIDLGLGMNEELMQNRSDADDSAVGALNETSLAQRGFFAKDLDDIDGSRAALARLLELARTMGEDGVARMFSIHAALAELLDENPTAAAVHLARSGFLPTDANLPPSALAATGALMIANSDWTALERLVETQRGVQVTAVVARDLYVHGLRGLAASAREDWCTAVEQLRLAAGVADERGIVELGRRFRVDLPLVEALFHSGGLDEARVRLGAVRELLGSSHRPISRIALHRASSLELASSGDLVGAVDEATVSIELARAAGRRSDEALALVYRARLTKRLRRTRASRVDLVRARELAQAAGNAALVAVVDRTEATLRRARSTTGLTPAEERVLEFVRAGESNKEISAQLFVSVRTVESHVAAIVRKTGAGSRLKLLVRTERSAAEQAEQPHQDERVRQQADHDRERSRAVSASQ